MGADLLMANLWSKREGPGPHDVFDWEAGLRVARELSDSACQRLTEQAGIYEEDGDTPARELRELAVQHVETLRQHIGGGYSRVLDVFATPDGSWTCWLTGGMSWGDSPSDLYDAMNDLWAVPEVLGAIGFWTGTEVAP